MGIETLEEAFVLRTDLPGRSRRPRTMGIETRLSSLSDERRPLRRSRRPRTMGIETNPMLPLPITMALAKSEAPNDGD